MPIVCPDINYLEILDMKEEETLQFDVNKTVRRKVFKDKFKKKVVN